MARAKSSSRNANGSAAFSLNFVRSTTFRRIGPFEVSITESVAYSLRRRADLQLFHRPAQRLQEGHEIALLLLSQAQFAQQHRLRLVAAAAGVVEVDHLPQ